MVPDREEKLSLGLLPSLPFSPRVEESINLFLIVCFFDHVIQPPQLTDGETEA